MKCDECMKEAAVLHVGYGICLCQRCLVRLTVCRHCGKRGHRRDRCPQLGRELKAKVASRLKAA
jgi:hypothetical protein